MNPAARQQLQALVSLSAPRSHLGFRLVAACRPRCSSITPVARNAVRALPARQQSTRPPRQLFTERKPARGGPEACTGCGAPFQTTTPDAPGYYPISRDSKPRPPSVHAKPALEATANSGVALPGTNPDGTLTPSELRTLLRNYKSNETEGELRICRRCHRLRHSNELRIRVYPDADKLLADVRINTGGLVVCIIDLADYPASVIRELSQLVGVDKPILLVGNKLDLLPPEARASPDSLVKRLKRDAAELGIANLRGVLLTSAHDGTGLFELCEAVAPMQAAGHNVYLVGNSNVGKSAIIRALREMAGLDKDRGPTASIMPGTTVGMVEIDMDLSQFAPLANEAQEGQTSNIEDNSSAKPTKAPTPGRLYDTPGLYSPSQITHALNTRELRIAIPRKPLRAQPYKMKNIHSVYIGGLYRLDITYAPRPIRLCFFTASDLPVHPCRTYRADILYAKHLGATDSPIMFPPIGPKRALEIPKLEKFRTIRVQTAMDLCFGGLGWVHILGDAQIVVYTPGGSPVALLREPLFSPKLPVKWKWMVPPAP
ncbi:hypothetical protein HDU86_007289 [Geranomyces michiganensis]|nr:hypothetical protein HDU86_007289 [Geranomyces michiganensis]